MKLTDEQIERLRDGIAERIGLICTCVPGNCDGELCFACAHLSTDDCPMDDAA